MMGSGKHLIAGLVGSAALFGSLATVPWSNAAVAQTPPNTPTGLTVSLIKLQFDSPTIVRLEWAGPEGATGFEVERAVGPTESELSAFALQETVPANEPLPDGRFRFEEPYEFTPRVRCYRVRAVAGGVASAYTPAVCAPVPPSSGADSTPGATSTPPPATVTPSIGPPAVGTGVAQEPSRLGSPVTWTTLAVAVAALAVSARLVCRRN